ncbi:MAG: nitroreductase family protein, partial [Sphingopyxis sp.]
MFNNLSSPLALLLSRRSGKARDMVSPGPDAAQMETILAAAARVPDHGKLAPWRFIIIPQDARDALSAMLIAAYRAERPDAGRLEVEAMDAMARQGPALVIALSTPVAGSKIPLWEQQLSAGAAAMQLLNAAHAHGFVGNWLT